MEIIVDLNDKSLRSGELQSMTAAINWYINKNLKLACNFVSSTKKKDKEQNTS